MHVRGTWALPWLVSACGFSPSLTDGGTVHDVVDAKVFLDMPIDTPATDNCFGTLDLDRVCYLKSGPQPTGTLNINVADLRDTETPGTCDGNAIVPASNPCVIAADKIIITGTGDLRVTGTRSLILLATGSSGININSGGTINVGSTTAETGAGGLQLCAGSTAAADHGGGFGGSFVAIGGDGGDDAQGNGHGVHATALTQDALQGGCPGGVGAADATAVPGNGGGGIALIGATIIIDGIVIADGGGGKGANNQNSGGGGGGAGGMIVLDSPTITGVGEINVKGGGGGGGTGGNTPGGDGKDGFNKLDRSHDSDGGTDMTSGGDGGDGGPRTGNDPTGEAGFVGVNGTAGGGGGGGAKGVIVTTSTPGGNITGAN